MASAHSNPRLTPLTGSHPRKSSTSQPGRVRGRGGYQKKRNIWSAKRIVSEDDTRYQIEWEGTDPNTGEPWPLTWEPKRNANAAFVWDWEQNREWLVDCILGGLDSFPRMPLVAELRERVDEFAVVASFLGRINSRRRSQKRTNKLSRDETHEQICLQPQECLRRQPGAAQSRRRAGASL